MKRNRKILTGLGFATIVGLLVYVVRRYQSRRRRRRVADEGYETAYDILYPIRQGRHKRGEEMVLHS